MPTSEEERLREGARIVFDEVVVVFGHVAHGAVVEVGRHLEHAVEQGAVVARRSLHAVLGEDVGRGGHPEVGGQAGARREELADVLRVAAEGGAEVLRVRQAVAGGQACVYAMEPLADIPRG